MSSSHLAQPSLPRISKEGELLQEKMNRLTHCFEEIENIIDEHEESTSLLQYFGSIEVESWRTKDRESLVGKGKIIA